MIAKILKRSSFGNVVNYVFKEGKDAKLLASEGVRTNSLQNIIACFNDQASQKSKVKNIVGHTALSFSEKDKHRLTDERMVQIAHDYMEKMKIKNTQYIIVRHFDRDHPHIHIVHNRVDNDGHTISDSNDQIRSSSICKELTMRYGLYMSKGKEKVKTHRLHGMDKEKFHLYSTIMNALQDCNNWDSFQHRLERRGITISFRRNENDNVHGICFTKDGHTYSGSKIDRSLGYYKLTQLLGSITCFHKTVNLDRNLHFRTPLKSNFEIEHSFERDPIYTVIESGLQHDTVIIPSCGSFACGCSSSKKKKKKKDEKPRKFRRR